MIERLNAALTGRYEILRELGEGGMATVYLAKDLKHNRNVAVKVLKPELAAVVGAERFLAEIETTANLQHPHILPLFDSGEADSFLFYVMPYVEGETLADRIARDKQLPVDEAVGIAASVAGALQVAHEAGVIHRDIKPGNILMSRDQPLVADFGIALAVGGGGARLTETGLSVGTPYYMSPEQATGDQSVGPAADIYALACVLYEMLVGEPPYLGNTAQAVLGKIIQGIPVSATAARKSIPPHVDAAIRKALEKLPADRFTRAGDFAGALSDPGFRHGELAAAGASSSAGPVWKRYAWPAAAALAGVAAVMGWMDSAPVEEAPVGRYLIDVPGYTGQIPWWFAGLAPDGSAVAFPDVDELGAARIFLKEDDEAGAAPLRGLGPDDIGYVDFSPDGDWLAVTTFRGDILKVGRSGGGATVLANAPGSSGLAWLDNGTIVVGAMGKLARLSENGGVIEEITFESVGGFVLHIAPLPRGRGFLFTAGSASGLAEGLWVYDASTGETRMVRAGVSAAWYGEPGLLVMAETSGRLISTSGFAEMSAARFNLETLEIEGPPVGMTEAVSQSLGFPLMVLSQNGTAMYVPGQDGDEGGSRLTWLNGEGAESSVDPSFSFMVQNNGGMRLSPDGSSVAMSLIEQGVTSNIFVKRLPDGPAQKVTFLDGVARRPTWHPDGTKILYVALGPEGREALWETRADGVGSPSLVFAEDRMIFEGLWSPDGEWVVYRTDDETDAARGDIMGIRPGVDSVPVPLAATPAEETSPSISPDGRFIAYSSTGQGGSKQIFVRPFPNVEDGLWQISSTGGTEPAWSPDGSKLYFWSGGGAAMMVAQLQTTPQFTIQSVQSLFPNRGSYISNDDHRWYDVSPDGDRFLMVGFVGSGTRQLVMVQNYWRVAREALGM